jgi:UDPglucose--hexose-1-phosphate uridylyltransferase
MSEFRIDPLTGRRVVIASERAARPKQLGSMAEADLSQPCPFCPGYENLTPPESWADRADDSQANQPGWSVRVVPNKYPAVTSDGASAEAENEATYRSPGTGAHEVIIESPAHGANLAMLDEQQYTRIFLAYRERLRAWREDPRWHYRLIFKNQGERAGATFEHAHAQVIALPFVPTDVEHELVGARAFYERDARCYYCALIEHERRADVRVVIHSAECIAFCPPTPRFAFETWILPQVHAAAFEETENATVVALARISRQVIVALNRLQADPPFNYFIQSLTLNENEREHYHWQLRLLPQFSRAAGFEWGSGMHINPIAPEDAARTLRDALI